MKIKVKITEQGHFSDAYWISEDPGTRDWQLESMKIIMEKVLPDSLESHTDRVAYAVLCLGHYLITSQITYLVNAVIVLLSLDYDLMDKIAQTIYEHKHIKYETPPHKWNGGDRTGT
jgi:hypothetical protein